jgi:hypothetical protein
MMNEAPEIQPFDERRVQFHGVLGVTQRLFPSPGGTDPGSSLHSDRRFRRKPGIGNDYASRTIKESCLNQMILFGEGSLRRAIQQFIEHYQFERNHQGLGNRLIISQGLHEEKSEIIRCRQRPGGLLNYYYRQAP